MARTKMTEEEKRWRAEDDARALKRYADIQNDPNRLREANKVINQELSNLSSVAKLTGANKTQKTASNSKGNSKKGAKTSIAKSKSSTTKTATKKSTANKKTKTTSKKGCK